MQFWKRIFASASAVCLGVVLAGCEPSGQSAADDEKEPHYILGQNRVNAMDFPGAVEAFEAALEANPHSAKAHFQLAMLYENEKKINPPDPAAAIYHYQQYLRFDPKASNSEVVTQRISSCRQQLASDVLPLPSSPAAQQQLQLLADKNRQLQDELDKWRAYYASQSGVVKTDLPPVITTPASQPATTLIPSTPVAAVSNPPVNKLRTHTVAARETPASIARKYKVSVNALLAANPKLDPRKLRVGQVINLPPS